MCNRYSPPSREQVALFFDVEPPADFYKPGLGPWGQGPFVRKKVGHEGREAVVGQWALIADGATKPVNRPVMTNNARLESVASKPTYKEPWARSQRCLIPAAAYDDPNWESGKNVWWRLARADGAPWGLAGLWNDWTDPATGEVISSYTMLTMNCDAHPLLSRMHKPERDLPSDQQDKRAVIPLEPTVWDQWLSCTPAQAREMLRLPPESAYSAGPAPTVPR
jgi:putative SOS response-associated peptidase YedK